MTMEKYKILIFGNKTFGGKALKIQSDLYDVTWHNFPSTEWGSSERLSNYSFIILDYAVFLGDKVFYPIPQEIFEKQLYEALDKGSSVVFFHYDEEIPRDFDDVKKLLNCQIGFRFLNLLSISTHRIDQPVHGLVAKRTEFKSFIDKWGSSKNYFSVYGEGNFDDIIVQPKDFPLAFSSIFKNGRLIYLPCQRNYRNIADLTEMFQTLINSLITYLTKLRSQIPDWAKCSFFNDEKLLIDELITTIEKKDKIEKALEPYKIAKSLAFASEYNLQKDLPKFLRDNLSLNTLEDETYNEDFWLLDSTGKKIAICETKSYTKGFSKNGVYSIYNHREYYRLDESFPAIIFVNLNLNAAGWLQKLSPIAPQDYQVATTNNVLILRVEDILFMWDAVQNNKITKEEIISLLTTSTGWLVFKPDSTYEIKK